MSIKDNVISVKERIANACIRCGRNENEITLIGVTKTRTADEINQCINAGITTIGENRVQELIEKYDSIDKSASIHLIGHLQTNKVKYIADKVELIHSVDSKKLADEISLWGKKLNKNINILIEVNISGEESKFGITPGKLDELLEYIETLEFIKVKGLMTIPPIICGDDIKSREIFKSLYKMFIDKKQKMYNNIRMECLSMGMSDDFEIAIEEGATAVRVGRALFGSRIKEVRVNGKNNI